MMMERILAKWEYLLENYTDLDLKTKSSLLISLLLAIVFLALMIYVLSMPEFLPGTIWEQQKSPTAIGLINNFEKL